MANTSFSKADADENLGEWAMVHKKQIATVAVALVVAIGGAWFYKSSEAKKTERSERAYYEALRTAMSGNEALGISDLRKVATRYKGTNAGTQSQMALVRVLYDQGKYQDGINELKNADPAEPFEASVHALLAAGYEQIGKFAEAGQEYLKAAENTRFSQERDAYKADAARAYMSGGEKDKAAQIWKELAADLSSPVSTEAAIRLGELTAKPATKS